MPQADSKTTTRTRRPNCQARAKPDPIFAALAESQKADVAYSAAWAGADFVVLSRRCPKTSTLEPKITKAARAKLDRTERASFAARKALLEVRPTTVRGLNALATHLMTTFGECFDDDRAVLEAIVGHAIALASSAPQPRRTA